MDKVILMNRFGIKTVVPTTTKDIEIGVMMCEEVPEQMIVGGKGKTYYYQNLIPKLQEEDVFFTSSENNQLDFSERWTTFLRECHILACLHSYLFNEEVQTLDGYA